LDLAVYFFEDELHFALDLNLLRVVVDKPAEVRNGLGLLSFLFDVSHQQAFDPVDLLLDGSCSAEQFFFVLVFYSIVGLGQGLRHLLVHLLGQLLALPEALLLLEQRENNDVHVVVAELEIVELAH